MDDVSDREIITTSFGKAVVIHRIEQIDEQPEVLACGYNVLLKDELERIASETPEQRARSWKVRLADIHEYRQRKAQDPTFTVDRGWA